MFNTCASARIAAAATGSAIAHSGQVRARALSVQVSASMPSTMMAVPSTLPAVSASPRNSTAPDKANIGIAYDGDADRAIFCDEKGKVVDGDAVMALCALHMIRQGRLRHNTLVSTVMSNLGLELALKEAGGRLVRAAVGDRYVMELMLEGGYNLGGEQSGHLIFLDHNTTGDGLITSLQVLSIMKQDGKTLSELAACMRTYPQVLVNVPVKEKRDLASVPEIAKRVADIEKALEGSGRLLVRYSGTEPKLRIMLEGEDEETIRKHAHELAEMVRNKLG